jgi:hypothetical protein
MLMEIDLTVDSAECADVLWTIALARPGTSPNQFQQIRARPRPISRTAQSGRPFVLSRTASGPYRTTRTFVGALGGASTGVEPVNSYAPIS